jgi:hypothetical protein
MQMNAVIKYHKYFDLLPYTGINRQVLRVRFNLLNFGNNNLFLKVPPQLVFLNFTILYQFSKVRKRFLKIRGQVSVPFAKVY